jgi:hypothetical protein
MKRTIVCWLLLLQGACAFHSPAILATENSNPPRALTPPAVWTPTKAPGSGTTEKITETYTTAATDTEASTPISSFPPTRIPPTETPITRAFDPAADAFIALVRMGTLYAVNWSGEIMPLRDLWKDDPINADVLHVEISPDRKSLALSGVGADGRPALEVLSLETLEILDRQIFEGTRITDYAWSPDSRSIILAVLELRTRRDFNTSIYRLDISENPIRKMILETDSAAVSQIERPKQDQIAYLDFTCQGAVAVELNPGSPDIYGKTGIGLFHPATHAFLHKVLAENVDFGFPKIVLSPNGESLLFLSPIIMTGGPATNTLLSSKDLKLLPCAFCHDYSDVVWSKDFLLAIFSMVGIPGGSVYIVNETDGSSRLLMSFESIGPNSRICQSRGMTAWIDDQSQIASGSTIVGNDIQACLTGDADPPGCARDMWSIEGRWPDGYNSSNWNLEIYGSD